jgi:hypothetical protein
MSAEDLLPGTYLPLYSYPERKKKLAISKNKGNHRKKN